MRQKTGVLFIQSQEGYGADSVVHTHLMRHLDRDRFTVHVACTAGSDPEPPESLIRLQAEPGIHVRLTRFVPGLRERTLQTVLRSVPQGLSAPFDFVDLREYVKRENIKVVHSSERPRDSLYTVGLAKVAGAKSVIHVHVKWSGIYSAPAKWAVNHADAVFSISQYVTGTVVSMGRDPGSIHTILNCVDPSVWDPSTDGSALRRELGVAPGAKVLASVSRLFSWKGQRELLQAFARVRERVSDVVLLIVGADAPHEGTSFTEELKGLARELGVAHHVHFTGPRSDIARVMAACDLYTMPSFEEPFGLVFLEAMAMGKPVIAIDNGGTPEVVAHGETGLLSQPWDIPALAQNIVRLLDDPALAKRMGERGRERVLRQFNPQRMAEEAGRAYETIVG